MEIDLGEEKDLDYIKIYPYDERSNTIKNIQLEVSSDGITYYILNMYPSVYVTMTNTGTSTVHTNQIYYDLKEFLLPNLSITTEQTIE